jgi:hypothetical protein
VGSVGLLTLITLPLLGMNKPRSERLLCMNNLRQIGIAFHTWSDSVEDKLPWQVRVEDGGTAGPLMDNAWYQFARISNELASPMFLGCPSDNARLAKRWDTAGDGGFLNPAYRNNSLSYFIGCHAEVRLPLVVLCGDRNIIPDATGVACSLGFQVVSQIGSPLTTVSRWSTTNLHSGFGNVLFAAGNVAELSTASWRRVASDLGVDNTARHLIIPR